MKFTQTAPPKPPNRASSRPVQDPALTWADLAAPAESSGLRFDAQAVGDGPLFAALPGRHERWPDDAAGLVIPLADHTVLRVSGTDARTFLQGQLTNNLSAIRPGLAQRTGLCSPKGRLIADFTLVETDDAFLLILSTSLAEPVRKRLSMFVLRASVEIQEVTADFLPFGYLGSQKAARLPDGTAWTPQMTAQTTDNGAIHLGLEPVQLAGQTWQRELVLHKASQLPTPSDDWPLAPTSWWRSGEVLAGVARLTEATTDAYVPQMINFELVGGVSFNKGCFPGQEVVARTQYLGKLKRRAAPGRVADSEPVLAGAEVTGSDGNAIGSIILAGPGAPFGEPDKQFVLFEARLAELEAEPQPKTGNLMIEPLELPYEVPVAERFERPDL